MFSDSLSGFEYLWEGPVFMLELPVTFKLEEFISLSVDVEISNLGEWSEESQCYVLLVDSNFNPVLALYWMDNFQWRNQMRYGVRYWRFVQSSIGFTTDPIFNQTFRHESLISKGNDSEIRFSLPTSEDRYLYVPEDAELLRNITRIVLMYGSSNYHPPVQSFLHDLTLEFNQALPSTTTQNNGSEETPSQGVYPMAIHPSTLIVWGISLVSIAVIITVTSKTIPHITEDS
jgi:hypothetical protein